MGNYGDRASLEGYSQLRGKQDNNKVDALLKKSTAAAVARNPRDLTFTNLLKLISVHAPKA